MESINSSNSCWLSAQKTHWLYSRAYWHLLCWHWLAVRPFYTVHWSVRKKYCLHTNARSVKKCEWASEVLFPSDYCSRTKLWLDASWISSPSLTHPPRQTFSWRAKVLNTPVHNALKWIPSLRDSTVQLTRWRPHLSKFDFDVVHRAGSK